MLFRLIFFFYFLFETNYLIHFDRVKVPFNCPMESNASSEKTLLNELFFLNICFARIMELFIETRKSKQANKVFGYNYSMPLDYRVAKLEQKATPA